MLAALLALGGTSGCGGSDTPPDNEVDAGGPDATPSDAGGNVGDAAAGDAMGMDAGAPAIIYINEVVTSPRHDWGHSSGDGEAFDGTPGTGRISSADQYIELYNAGTTTVDLRGWTIDMRDSGSETAVLGEDNEDLRVSAGSTLRSVKPGAFVLLGNPPGTMANDLYIVLKDAQGNGIDDVEIGGVERDAEDDGDDDGAPGPGENGFARGAFDEAIARPVGAGDTDVDQVDFVKMYATPMAPNEPPAPPDETVPPDVSDVPAGSSFPVTQLISIGFDEAIAAASVDGNVILTADGSDLPIELITFAEEDSRVALSTVGRLPFDTDITITLKGGAGGITDLAGNPLPDDIPPFTIHTEEAPGEPGAVLLNELCIAAQRDWDNDQGGDNIPFSPSPGIGDVSSSDEWIELLVRQDGLDLSGYVLEVFNGPSLDDPAVSLTPLADADYVRFFGTGTSLTTVEAGDRVVIGNPTDSMNDSVFVALRDGAGALVDVVEVGGNVPEEDRGGDGIENGAPGPGLDGDSTMLANEVLARVPDGTDTGDDAGDWSHAQATLGAENPDVTID